MKTYFHYVVLTIGLFLCSSSSAQSLPFLKGSIVLENGTTESGYLTLLNSQKIVFKTEQDASTITYRVKSVKQFTYGKERFRKIQSENSSFFVREIIKGKMSLFKRELSPNPNKVYFIKTEEGFAPIAKSSRYDDLKAQMSNISIFENYDKTLFMAAYHYNQNDLKILVNSYNVEHSRTMMAFDFAEENDTLIDNILGFATLNQEGTGTNSTKNARLPNTVRNDLVLKSEVIYNQILDAVRTDNWKRVDAVLKLLQPLASEIEALSGQDLYQDLWKYSKLKQSEKFKRTLVLFISEGVQSLMQSADRQNQIEVRKLVVRQAFVEFLEINDELKKIDPALADKIMGQFKAAFTNAANSSKFNSESAKIQASLQSLTHKV